MNKDRINDLIKKGDYSLAEGILADAIQEELNHPSKEQVVTPWYYERLAVTYRKQRLYAEELELLYRFRETNYPNTALSRKLIERTDAVRDLLARQMRRPALKMAGLSVTISTDLHTESFASESQLLSMETAIQTHGTDKESEDEPIGLLIDIDERGIEMMKMMLTENKEELLFGTEGDLIDYAIEKGFTVQDALQVREALDEEAAAILVLALKSEIEAEKKMLVPVDVVQYSSGMLYFRGPIGMRVDLIPPKEWGEAYQKILKEIVPRWPSRIVSLAGAGVVESEPFKVKGPPLRLRWRSDGECTVKLEGEESYTVIQDRSAQTGDACYVLRIEPGEYRVKIYSRASDATVVVEQA